MGKPLSSPSNGRILSLPSLVSVLPLRAVVSALLLLMFLAGERSAHALDSLRPDDVILGIRVIVHTGDVNLAGTDNDVYLKLWSNDPSEGPSLDNPNDNFERNATEEFQLPWAYFHGHIVNDIDMVRIHKSSDDLDGGWAFSYVRVLVTVNHEGQSVEVEIYASPNAQNPGAYMWLEDGYNKRTWQANDFKRVEFQNPTIIEAGLRDAGPSEAYQVPLTVSGGRKPINWTLSNQVNNEALTSFPMPALVPPGNVEAGVDPERRRVFAAKTITPKTANGIGTWSGRITVTDADGRSTGLNVSMKVVTKLDPPQLTGYEPTFGWPGVTVTIHGANFDSRRKDYTRIFFTGVDGNPVEAVNLEGTADTFRCKVPAGAGEGPLFVKTAFGETGKVATFTAHPYSSRFLRGFSFSNSKQNFGDEWYDWDEYQLAFGKQETNLCADGICTDIPNPVAYLFYLITGNMNTKGNCHGFSLTSLQMDANILTTSFEKQGQGYPLANSIWDFTGPNGPSDGLKRIIQSRQIAMLSSEAIGYYVNKIQNTPRISLGQMNALPAYQSVQGMNSQDPLMLAFAKGYSPLDGHVVLPYAAEGGANPGIRVYDPNKPAQKFNRDDKNSFFPINLGPGGTPGDWNYTFSDGSNWEGLYMFTIPLSAYGHQVDWTIPGNDLANMIGLASAGGDATIEQVTDTAGKTLYAADGSVKLDPAEWPDGVVPVPLFDVDPATAPKLIGIMKKSALTFKLKQRPTPTGALPQPGILTFFRGANFTASVEDVRAPLSVSYDFNTDVLRTSDAATAGSSPIVRFRTRDTRTAESLSYAVRLININSGKAVTALPLDGGRRVMLKLGNQPLQTDVEVMVHTRIGERKVQETDKVDLPANAEVTLGVETLTDLEAPGKTPLRVTATVPGMPNTVKDLGPNVTGPVIVAKQRVIAPAVDPGAAANVSIDVSESRNAGQPLPPNFQFRTLYSPAAVTQNQGVLNTQLGAGSVPLNLIVEDTAGNRSFPRTVMVTVPRKGDVKVATNHRLFGTDTLAKPGETVGVPVGLLLDDITAVGASFNLSVESRLSGFDTEIPKITGLTRSRTLAGLNGKVTMTPDPQGKFVHFNVTWDEPARGPLGNKIDLGTVNIQIPSGLNYGNTFLLTSTDSGADAGSVVQKAGQFTLSRPLSILPTSVRVWGGVEPASLSIVSPDNISEDDTVVFKSSAGQPARGDWNGGWWIERMGGDADLSPDPDNASWVRFHAVRAGLVKLHLVQGTVRAEAIVRIKPSIYPKAVEQDSKPTFPLPFPPIELIPIVPPDQDPMFDPSLTLIDPDFLSVIRTADIYQKVSFRAKAGDPERFIRKGDLNADEKVDIADAVIGLQALVGQRQSNGFGKTLADTDKNGAFNVTDVVATLRFAVGLPVGG